MQTLPTRTYTAQEGAMLYKADDGNAEIEIEAETSYEAAQEYVDDGDWGCPESTIWITVWVWPADGDPEDREKHTISVHPEEPECEGRDEHEWIAPHAVVGGMEENPGVWGSGGGVIIHEVCPHCATEKVVDTWATDPSDGTQGHTLVRYADADADAIERWKEQEWDLYAILDQDEIDEVERHPNDEAAQAWFAREAHAVSYDPDAQLVTLDLAPGQSASCGDLVEVDEDGVATLVTEAA